MISILNIKQLHREAMAYAQEAIFAQENGQDNTAIAFYEKAFELEKQAALSFLYEDKEPTRSVLFRSAATLAKKCGKYREAEKYVNYGLSGNPPDEIAEELRNLYEEINFHRHLSLKSEILDGSELQLSISGNGVSYGLAPSEEFGYRIRAIEDLTIRSAERLLGKDYRTSGQASKEIREQCNVYLATPMAASFAVKIRLGKPTNQTSLDFGSQIQERIVDDILTGIELINNQQESELKKRFTNENYLQNFIGLTKALSPDGDVIKQVGLTVLRKGKEKSVSLIKKRSDVPIFTTKIENKLSKKSEDGESFQMTGYLKVADGLKGSIQILPESGITQNIEVPSGLSDIVKIFWEEKVKVTFIKKGKKIILQDLDKIH